MELYYTLLCVRLLSFASSASGETTALTNSTQYPGPSISTTSINNLSYTTEWTSTGETATFVNLIDDPGPDNNLSKTSIHTATEDSVILKNDNNSSSKKSRTETEKFSYSIVDAVSGNIITHFNKTPSSGRADDSVSTTGETTKVSDNEQPITEEIPESTTCQEFEATTSTFECEEVTSVNISQKYQELTTLRDQLDELFEETMTSCRSFVEMRNKRIGESTINLANKYLKLSKKFLNGVQLESKIIECQNITSSEEYKIDDIDEYKEKLEIVDILSDEVGKAMRNETTYEIRNTTEEILPLFEELYSIVTLNKRIKELETLGEDQYNNYKRKLRIADLDEVITTITEVIKIKNEILKTVNSSNYIKYLHDEEHSSKSNMTRDLVNVTNIEEKLNSYEEFLIQECEEHDIEKALILMKNVVRPTVLGIIFVVGIIGNGILFLVFVRHEEMQTLPNMMVIHLNVCDILGLFVNILSYMIETMAEEWTLGVAVCKLYRFSRYLTLGLSIYSIVVISVQRFLALTDYFSPAFRCRFFGRSQSLFNVLFVWIVASAAASPRALKATVDDLQCLSGTSEDQGFFDKYLYVDFTVYCAVPFIIIALTSGMTSARLKTSIKNMPGEVIGKEKVIKKRALSSNVFLVLVAVFAISYMPYFIFMTFSRNLKIDAPFITQKYISFGLYCLIHANATFNPIALYLVCSKYRKLMGTYLCCGYPDLKCMNDASDGSNATVDTRM